jgi:hypothetical protein
MRIMRKEEEGKESYAFITGNDYEAEYTICSAKTQTHEIVKMPVSMVVEWLKDMDYAEIELRGDIEE